MSEIVTVLAHMPADGVGEWSPKNFRGETFDSAHEAALTAAGKGADYLRQVSLAPSRTLGQEAT